MLPPDPSSPAQPTGDACQWLARVSAYHDGEMDGASILPFERHLNSCTQCAAELAELRRVSSLFSNLDTQRMREQSIAGVHETVDHEAPPQRNLLSIGLALSGLAASALIIGMAWLAELPAPRPASVSVSISYETGSWEQVALSDRGVDPLPRGLWEAPDQPMLADARTADWMLQNLTRGGQP
jgi:anti-sigma factor RsiW